MDTKFTKGPWIVNPICAQVDCSAISELGGLLPVCQLLWPTDERTEEETEANGHLIAASPNLYEALEELYLKAVVGTYEERHTALNKAWAALAKARGEGA